MRHPTKAMTLAEVVVSLFIFAAAILVGLTLLAELVKVDAAQRRLGGLSLRIAQARSTLQAMDAATLSATIAKEGHLELPAPQATITAAPDLSAHGATGYHIALHDSSGATELTVGLLKLPQ